MKNLNKIKRERRERRHRRVRATVKGTNQRPRLSVFRSNQHVFLQLIDDEKRKTIVSASDLKPKAGPARGGEGKKAKTNIVKMTKTKLAFSVGKALAELAKKKKIKYAIFDRGGYAYSGRVKAAAEGAREGGLKF
ncbi:MAG: 50S ribosomal protein L18 [bacterium]|nr:50S ribosomal protein L18 [bacterium]